MLRPGEPCGSGSRFPSERGHRVADVSVEMAMYVSGVICLAATLQGISGFGFNMLAVPALILVYPPQVVVPGVLMTYLPLGAGQVVQLRRDIDVRLWGTLVASAAGALPIGALILRHTDAALMKPVIGTMMVLLALLLQLRPGAPLKRELGARIGGGFISGVLAASTGVSGPPLVLLGLKQGWHYRAFRATLLTYFLSVSFLSLPFHWGMDLVNSTSIGFALSGLPGLFLGFLAGTWFRNRVGGRTFRWVAVGMVMCGGLAAVIF